jgi:cytochrome c2/glucose/arabinose dehydrogenase
MSRLCLFSLLLCCLTSALSGADKKSDAPDKPKPLPKLDPIAQEAAKNLGPLADWIEPDFPFFSSVLDARDVGEGFPKDNLTPRGLILNLGHDLWACFDTDLLRIALIWQSEPGQPPVTLNALASGSYQIAGQKTKDGQDFLVKPQGKVLLANGIYPGWQVGSEPSNEDPRQATPTANEVGRGPLPLSLGQFKEVRMSKGHLTLVYEAGGASIEDCFKVEAQENELILTRELNVGPTTTDLILLPGEKIELDTNGKERRQPTSTTISQPPLPAWAASAVRISAHRNAVKVTTSLTVKNAKKDLNNPSVTSPQQRFSQTLTTKATLSTKKEAYVLDDIPLPMPNPWKRNVRLADIAFLDDQGHAAAVTMDGDVWLLSGLKGDLQEVTWKRFTSGLHEPMSICVRKEMQDLKSQDSRSASVLESSHLKSSIFVFDRNGIWKLIDTNGDNEADVHEMFCNQFGQTAETREFPNSMKLAPDGALIISKGGQEGATHGKDNGKVLRISPDGKTITQLAYGLRGPFIGVHPKSGLVTASDQQGNYVPSTPLHIIRDNQFYGHLPTISPEEQYPAPIADPLTWIPHPVNASGVTQTWLCDAKMESINDELIHIGYNRPELLRVLMNDRPGKPQATVVPFFHDFEFAPLNAAVNPADGQLYITGFQIWGTTAKRISGLARLRYTGEKRVLLKACTPMEQGVLLTFTEPLEKTLATNPDSYSIERWNYKRTPQYGSPHLKLDGSAGQDWMTASSAYLSQDSKSVFLGIPEMKQVMQMRVGWGLKSAEGLPAQNNAYFTPYELAKFDATLEGFGDIKVDLTPRKIVAAALVEPTVEEGQRLYQMFGCMACHSVDGSVVGKVGPSWKGLFGTTRELTKDAGKAKVDEAYLRESIANPNAKVAKGYEKFDAGMPIYAGILNDSQIESLVMFIKTLK